MAYYYYDLSLVHGLIFIVPCIILSLFKLWTKIIAKTQAEILSRKLNEEFIKLVWTIRTNKIRTNSTETINQTKKKKLVILFYVMKNAWTTYSYQACCQTRTCYGIDRWPQELQGKVGILGVESLLPFSTWLFPGVQKYTYMYYLTKFFIGIYWIYIRKSQQFWIF